VLHVLPIFNFHEGGNTFAILPDGSVPPVDSSTMPTLVVSVLDDGSFRLGLESFKSTTYVFVQEARRYVARNVLTGEYKDRRGLRYEFREDGWAIFPDRKFKFEIGMDHVLTGFDYFMEIDQHGLALSTSAFHWKDGKLQVFRTKAVDGVDEIIDRRPQLLLQSTQ
jgi:hypothetical protein